MIGAQVFSRRGVEKDERARAIEEAEVERLRKDQEDETRIIRGQRAEQACASSSSARRPPTASPTSASNEEWLEVKGDTISEEILADIPRGKLEGHPGLRCPTVQEKVDRIC